MKKAKLHLDITIDYLKGLKYSEIQKKYKVNRWDIQNALSKTGFTTHRIRSGPRLPGRRKKKLKRYRRTYRRVAGNRYRKPEEDNPVLLEDDLDIMERIDDEKV